MLTEDICKALYALPGGVVVPRRRTVVMPMIITFIGVALLVMNSMMVEDSAGATAMTLTMAGTIMLCYGIVATIVRLRSKSMVPYDQEAKCYMRYRERYYDHELLSAVRKALATNDDECLEQLPTSSISAIILVEYRTPGGRRAAYALYEYQEFEYRLIEPPVLVSRNLI